MISASISWPGKCAGRVRPWFVLAALVWFAQASPADEAIPWQHGLGYYGLLKYAPGFEHFEWVNPDAPKGGKIVLSGRQRYTSFNPIATKGTPVAGVILGSSQQLLYDPLLERANDEVGSAYGRLAEAVYLEPDYSAVWFKLRKEARFHDGVPVTAEDVAFTFEMLKAYGAPEIKSIYGDVTDAVVLGSHTIRFEFAPGVPHNPDLALEVGNIFAMPRHYWKGRDFEGEPLTPPVGSGPYQVGDLTPGRMVEWHRVDDYWGRDIPVNKGRFNFGVVRYDYFLDIYVAREAVRAGDVDIIQDSVATSWATAWNIDSVHEGRLLKYPAEVAAPFGAGWVAFLFNLRSPKFQDARVREALWLLRDFPWYNEIQQFSTTARAESYFTGTPFASTGLPDKRELELLEPLRELIPSRVLDAAYQSPPSAVDDRRREYILEADRLLREAGWIVRDGKRVNETTGEPFFIDFPFGNALGLKIAGLFVYNLESLGIEVSLRQMESSRYLYMLREGDFDLTLTSVGSELIPAAGLRNRYHSSTADMMWSTNWGGIKDPAVDALIEVIESAKDMEEHLAAVRALDRVLLWNFYVIPGFYAPTVNLVHWNRFGRPERQGAYSVGYPDTWWFDEEKAMRIADDDTLAVPPPPVLTGDELFRRSQVKQADRAAEEVATAIP